MKKLAMLFLIVFVGALSAMDNLPVFCGYPTLIGHLVQQIEQLTKQNTLQEGPPNVDNEALAENDSKRAHVQDKGKAPR